jgi:RNA polymerase sigma factor (sigma-70 family)
LSDELLARYAARGSDRAFSVLYERYSQPLYGYCRSIVRNEADAQDALQSAFTSALVALRRDGRNAPLRPWLYRIAHNEAISLLRRRSRDIQHDVVPEPSVLGPSAEEEAADRARWRRLVDDLAELPERQRGALLLRELAGLSHEDIAISLGLTVGGAKQAIFEARQGLAEVEEGRAMSCEEVRQRMSEGDRRVLRGRRVRSHLRECAACEAFALAIPARRTELRAMAPALPPAAAAMMLTRVLRTASPHGGASAAAGSAVTAGAVGKAAGTAMVWKAVGATAIVATAAAGVSGLTHILRHNHPAVASAPRAHASAAPVSPGRHATHQAVIGHAAAHRVAHARSSGSASHRAALPGHTHHNATAVSRGASNGTSHTGRHTGSVQTHTSNGRSATTPVAHGRSVGHTHARSQPGQVRHTRASGGHRSHATPHRHSMRTAKTSHAKPSGAVNVQRPNGAANGAFDQVTGKVQKAGSTVSGH